MNSANDECDSPGWHTDPENPMLGPDGQLRDARERPQQFVHSPSEATSNFHLRDYTEDDLPAAQRMDVITRPKRTIKLITRENPLDALEQEKLAAKSKAVSTSKKKNSDKPCQETLNAFSKFKIRIDRLKIPQLPASTSGSDGAPGEVESSASETESIKVQKSTKRQRPHQEDLAVKRTRISPPIASESMPSPTNPLDIPSNNEEDAPGANRDNEEFERQDAQVAQSIQSSQKARRMRDLETVFTSIVDEKGKKFRICRVCK